MRRLRCRACDRPLKDRLSLRYGIGPDCRKGLSGEQLAAALKLTREEAQPGYIPPARPVSFEARANNAEAHQAGDVPTCAAHGGILGSCPQCRQDWDLAFCVARIIAQVRAERTAERDRRYLAAKAQQVDVLGLFEVADA